jgi:hypothetical protein
MNERFIAFSKFLISDQKFPEPVEPGVGRFHNPTSVLGRTSASSLLSRHPWGISARTDLLASWFSVISLIRIQESLSSFWKGNDDSIEHGNELAGIMSIRPGNDQRQRDATAVRQDMTLASLFSPGL